MGTCSFCQSQTYELTIDSLDKSQTFNIPIIKHDGWCTAGIRITQNTANDTVQFSNYIKIAPGWTGLLYHNDHYGCKPFTFTYLPYKATTGKISIEWSYSY